MGSVSSGRNKRSVWQINTAPFKDAHFATFPPKLIEPMILAGCPPTVCAACGAPYEHVVERATEYDHVTSADGKSKLGSYVAQTGNGAGTHDIRHGVFSRATSRGYVPTCDCHADTNAGVVLDMFGGSGTTALVARLLGRHYLLSDLNPKYVRMAQRRLRRPFEVVEHEPDAAKPVDFGLFAVVPARGGDLTGEALHALITGDEPADAAREAGAD